jgi:mono/diheme cytochrome c family protein
MLRSCRAALGALVAAALISASIANAAEDCGESDGDWHAGSAIYHQTCVACHGVRAGVPDFATGVMAYSTRSLLRHIKNGFHVPGRPLAMPPKGNNPALTDEDIRNVLAYLRHAFGCG